MRALLKNVVALFLTSSLFVFVVQAETVYDGGLAASGTYNGDVVVVNGNMTGASGAVVINGDLKVIDGRVDVTGTGRSLTVFGDVIVINTVNNSSESVGGADVRTTGDLIVYGEIYVRSVYSKARVYSQAGALKAGSIYAHGKLDAQLDTESLIDVEGDIIMISDEGEGRILLDKSSNGYLHAANITTSSKNAAYIGCRDFIGGIDVPGNISLFSSTNDAYVEVLQGDIYAGSITTSASGQTYIYNWLGDITVRGPLKTYSESSNAEIYLDDGSLVADYLYTDAYSTASVYVHGSSQNLHVKGHIFTRSLNDASKVDVSDGDLYAGSITTSAYLNASAHANGSGSVNVKGAVITDSLTDHAAVFSRNHYFKAGELFTTAYLDAYVDAQTGLEVAGPIVTRSYTQRAFVKTDAGSLSAQEIFTHGYTDAFVKAAGGDLNVRGDIFTKSDTDDAYVSVSGGNLYAKSIHTEAPDSNTNYDKITVSGTAEFEYIPRHNDVLVEFSNAEFSFNADQEWNSPLELSGTCTFNGNGTMLNFGTNGSIIAKSDATVTLKNVAIGGVGADMIRCENDNATIYLQNVTWTLTDNYDFNTGSFQVIDNFTVKGNKGLSFAYKSSQNSTIQDNSFVTFDHGVIFNYDTAAATRLQLGGANAGVIFNKGKFIATQDCILDTGSVLTNGLVSFSAGSGKTLNLTGLGGLYINGTLLRGPGVYTH